MLVKKFEAPTMEKALALVRAELGPNALVLSTHQRPRRWYQRPLVEVTAAGVQRAAEEERDAAFDEEELKRVFPHRKHQLAAAPAAEPEEADEVPAPAVTCYADLERGRTRPAPEKKSDTRAARQPLARAERYTESFLRSGFGADTAKELTRRLIFDYPNEDRTRPSQLLHAKSKLVAQDLRTLSFESILLHPAWSVVGVGGSGKTSLLVKLALAMKARGVQSVLVGGDRRKIAARAELAGYARLVKSAFAFEAKPAAICMGQGIQLVDTPALAFDREDWQGHEKLCRDSKVILCLEASCRYEDAMRIVERAQRLNPQAIAFTKLDVVGSFGAIYDVLRTSKLPLLGVSVSPSFKTPFRFFEPIDAAYFILKGKD
jgi:flagellar biosynthesis protein FlhF